VYRTLLFRTGSCRDSEQQLTMLPSSALGAMSEGSFPPWSPDLVEDRATVRHVIKPEVPLICSSYMTLASDGRNPWSGPSAWIADHHQEGHSSQTCFLMLKRESCHCRAPALLCDKQKCAALFSVEIWGGLFTQYGWFPRVCWGSAVNKTLPVLCESCKWITAHLHSTASGLVRHSKFSELTLTLVE
jgi:hypothetical protein